MPPKEREGKKNFTEEVATYFETLDVCFMTTNTLFQLWKKVMKGQIDKKKVKDLILSKKGELTLRDFD